MPDPAKGGSVSAPSATTQKAAAPQNFRATGEWTRIGYENSWCTVASNTLVRFGLEGHGWVQKIAVGADPLVAAKMTAFPGQADPAPGLNKVLEKCSSWMNLDELFGSSSSSSSSASAAERDLEAEFAATATGPLVCMATECLALYKRACTHHHAQCGHACGGVRDEHVHLPCLDAECQEKAAEAAEAALENSALAADDDAKSEHGDEGNTHDEADNPSSLVLKCCADDLCGVCFTSELCKEPCVALACGHAFHETCLRTRLTPPSGGRLVFAFLKCPMCAAPVASRDPGITALIAPQQKLARLVSDLVWDQIAVDHLETDERVIERSSLYYGDVHRFALDTYNYYKCHRCTKPYFGGRRVCDAVPVEGGAAVGRAEDFVCTPCLNSMSTNACKVPAHQNSLVWKCRYCCTPAGMIRCPPHCPPH